MANTLAKVGYWRIALPSLDAAWSEYMYEMFGFDPDTALSGLKVVGSYHPNDRDAVGHAVDTATVQDGPVTMEYRVIRADGEVRHIWTRMVRERNPATGRYSLFGINMDISDVREGDAELIESERHFRFMANYSRDLLTRYDADGRVTYASPAVVVMTGYEVRELIGQTPWHFIHTDDLPALLAGMKTIATTGQKPPAPPNEFRFLHKTKGWIWIESNPRLITDPSGQVIEIIDMLRDVTDRKLAEQETRVAKAAAENQTRLKSEFLATLSHELRTPLTGIIGLSEMIGTDSVLGPKDRRHLDLVQQASRQLITIINNVLDMSRLEAGAVQLDQEPFRLIDTVQTVMDIMRVQAQEKGLDLILDMAPDLPLLRGDPGRLSQVLYNLIGNAIKYTGSGRVTLALNLTNQGPMARIDASVSDSGIGLDTTAIEQLFQRFIQGQMPQTHAGPGAGLGLAISRQMVELMGGQIFAENLPGGGSRFWFSLSLPLVTDGVDNEAIEPPATPAATLTRRRPMRVLLAEDNAFSQELIRTCLRPLGCELQTVDNGQAAVIAAQRQVYDLILMDIRMPGMDGHAATRAIRALGEAWLRVPIIALSGNVLPADVDECLAAGMNDHVGKPILPSALFAAIDRHVRVGP